MNNLARGGCAGTPRDEALAVADRLRALVTLQTLPAAGKAVIPATTARMRVGGIGAARYPARLGLANVTASMSSLIGTYFPWTQHLPQPG